MARDNTASAGAELSRPPHSRETQRERERLSRVRRAERLDRMRRQMKTLECALEALRAPPDTARHVGDVKNADVQRVREYLRRSALLLEQSKQLKLEKRELQKHLTDHDAVKHTMARLLQESSVDLWEWNVKRWRAFTRLHFQPWTREDVQAEIDAGLREMNAFWYGKGDLRSLGLSFLGWRDQRRINPDTNALQFSLYKTFRGGDMHRHMDQYWTIYRTPELYTRIILGDQGRGALDVLQEVAPHISIVRYVEQYPGMNIHAHFLYLLYRVETERGFTQCLRSIQSLDLQLTAAGEADVWASNFFWFRWEVLGHGNDLRNADYRLTVSGSLAGGDVQYPSHWLCEVVATCVRAELLATGMRLLT